MCIIIDTNVAARVLLCFDDPDFAPVTERLFGSRKPPVRLVYGGRLLTEYVKNDDIRRIMIELDRAGRAIRISDDKINEEERTLNGTVRKGTLVADPTMSIFWHLHAQGTPESLFLTIKPYTKISRIDTSSRTLVERCSSAPHI